MNIVKEINEHAAEADKPVLLGLFAKYHMSSQWRFVARANIKRYGVRSYEIHRVWEPTEEGRVLYSHLIAPNV